MNKFQINADSFNAMLYAQGALAMCIARVLTPEQRLQLAKELADLAKNAEKHGNEHLETMLIDLYNAVV